VSDRASTGGPPDPAARAGADGPAVRVSVLVMTYNHAPFIRQALDSVLMQRTSFGYEVLVSEDCSTDGTREIVGDYQRRFPEKIRLIVSDRNLHSNAVVSRGIRASRGEFIALLDGDDYWTDPGKLQAQVDFLDAHADCSACFHDATAVYHDGSRPPRGWVRTGQKPFMTVEDIWRGNPLTLCSTMFRNRLYELPAWYDRMPLTDWPLHILNAEHGRIGYMDRAMAVYRIHSGGEYSGLDELARFETQFRFYTDMNRAMGYRCDALARNGLFSYFLEWAEEFAKRGDRRKAWFCARKCFSGRPLLRSRYKRLFRVVRWVVAQSVKEAVGRFGAVKT
jgi:glycosyltransferase involved in cell wall biosynthesis